VLQHYSYIINTSSLLAPQKRVHVSLLILYLTSSFLSSRIYHPHPPSVSVPFSSSQRILPSPFSYPFSSFTHSFFPSSRSFSLFPFLKLYFPPSCLSPFSIYLPSLFSLFRSSSPILSACLTSCFSYSQSHSLSHLFFLAFSLSLFSAPCPPSLYSCYNLPLLSQSNFSSSQQFLTFSYYFPAVLSLFLSPHSFPLSILLSL
jgi:hypothetical protein